MILNFGIDHRGRLVQVCTKHTTHWHDKRHGGLSEKWIEVPIMIQYVPSKIYS